MGYNKKPPLTEFDRHINGKNKVIKLSKKEELKLIEKEKKDEKKIIKKIYLILIIYK